MHAVAVPALVAIVAAVAVVDGAGARPIRITIHGGGAFGGDTYGLRIAFTGATISQSLDVEVDARGEIRISDVAATLDPASIHLTDRTEPALAIAEQRFIQGALTPTQTLARSVGARVTVTTPKGEQSGILRAADEDTLVLDSAGTLAVLRRAYVLDLRVADPDPGRSTLIWRVAAKKPGKHTVDLSYRAEGLEWSPDYLAVLDPAARTIDFTALATIRNATGATFERAELSLISGAYAAPSLYRLGPQFAAPPSRYSIAAPVTLVPGQTVQVDLVPRQTGIPVRPVVIFESMPDVSASYQEYPNTDCTQWSGIDDEESRASLTVQLDVPGRLVLPEGRVRVFERANGRSELVNEERLVTAAGTVRIRTGDPASVTGARKATACKLDERARSVTEKVEVVVTNEGATATEVIVREHAWRWPVWRLERESTKSHRDGRQALEYRLALAPRATQKVTYSLVYSW